MICCLQLAVRVHFRSLALAVRHDVGISGLISKSIGHLLLTFLYNLPLSERELYAMLMKDGLDGTAIKRISSGLKQLMPDFDVDQFDAEALKGLAALELKQRVQHLIRVLHQHLPGDFRACAEVLGRLPEVWDYGNPDNALRGFAAWPLIDYVAEYGLNDPASALCTLERLTPLFSAEFAIRSFIQHHPEVSAESLRRWLTHPSEHVRRLVSEGTRPRLPWGKQLKHYIADPTAIIPLLDALRFDHSLYVRRSVANNLNDIGKDHPELLIETCLRWRAADQGKTDWIIRHATRSLVKAGHPAAFPLLGYTVKPEVELLAFALGRKELVIGEALPISLHIRGLKPGQRLVVDYAIHYQKARGKLSRKVFKWKNLELEDKQTIQLAKQLPFKPITTRTYYSGEHHVAVYINGLELARQTFWLTVD